MIEARLWRPAAQRSVRNAWGYLEAQFSAWSSASAAARLAATNLVNAYLLQHDVGVMDLGVLGELEGIRENAKIKLRAQQAMFLRQYLSSYDALVMSVSEMRSISVSMRTYVKDSGRGPLIEFTKDPTVDGDTGDGGGVAVFAILPLRAFEEFANELCTMFQKELQVKWLLALEFHRLGLQGTEAASSRKELHLDHPFVCKSPKDLTFDECAGPAEFSPIEQDKQLKPTCRETLQIYLTALLAEVHICRHRIKEVTRLWTEEMAGGFLGSPLR